MDGIAKNLVAFKAEAIFGVFPTPVLAWWDLGAEQAHFLGSNVPRYPCYASWNIQRSEEGKPPTFIHKQWMQVASCCAPPVARNQSFLATGATLSLFLFFCFPVTGRHQRGYQHDHYHQQQPGNRGFYL